MSLQNLERRFEKRIQHSPGFVLSVLPTQAGVFMSEIVKVCIHCGPLKIDQVYISKERMQCKPCHKRTNEKNKERHKDRINAFIREDRKINPEKYALRQKKYHKKIAKSKTPKNLPNLERKQAKYIVLGA